MPVKRTLNTSQWWMLLASCVALFHEPLPAQPAPLTPESYLRHEDLTGSLSHSGRWAMATLLTPPAAESTAPQTEFFDTKDGSRSTPLGPRMRAVLARWSPDDRYVAVLVGSRGSFHLRILASGAWNTVWDEGPFTLDALTSPVFRWVTSERFIMQASRLDEESISGFAVTPGAAELLQGWNAYLAGRPSATILDSRVPVPEQIAVDVWFGDVGTKKLARVFRCPEITEATISPGGEYVGLLTLEDRTYRDAGFRGGDFLYRAHAADFFAWQQSPRHLLHTSGVLYISYATGAPAWRNSGEVALVVNRDKSWRWLRVRFANATAQTRESVIPKEIGDPHWWFFAGDWLLVHGFSGNKSRWFAAREDRVLPFHDLFPGVQEPAELLRITASGAPLVAGISPGLVDVVDFSAEPRAIRSVVLPAPVKSSLQRAYPLMPEVRTSLSISGAKILLTDARKELFAVDTETGAVRRVNGTPGDSLMLGIGSDGSRFIKLHQRGVQLLVHHPFAGAGVTLRTANTFYREQVDPVIQSFTFQPDRLANGVSGPCCQAFLYLPTGATKGEFLPLVLYMYLSDDHPKDTFEHAMSWGMPPLHDPRFYTSNGYAFMGLQMPWKMGFDVGDSIETVAAYVLPAVTAAIKTGWVDRERIAFVGHSFGGLNVLQLLTRTDIGKAAISAAGPYSLTAEWGSFDPSETAAKSANDVLGQAAWAENGQAGLRGPPWQDAARYLYNSADTHVTNIRTPVLLIKGDQDFVSQNAAQYAFQSLRRVGVPTRLVLFRGSAHVPGSATVRAIEAKEILDWLATYLGKPDRPAPAASGHAAVKLR